MHILRPLRAGCAALCALLAVSVLPAAAQFTTIDVDTTLQIDDSVYGQSYSIVDGSQGPTEVRLAEGLLGSSSVEVTGASRFMVAGGELNRGSVDLRDQAELHVVGGKVVGPAISAAGESTIRLASGDFRSSNLTLQDAARLQLAGASVRNIKATLKGSSQLLATSGRMESAEFALYDSSSAEIDFALLDEVTWQPSFTLHELANVAFHGFHGRVELANRSTAELTKHNGGVSLGGLIYFSLEGGDFTYRGNNNEGPVVSGGASSGGFYISKLIQNSTDRVTLRDTTFTSVGGRGVSQGGTLVVEDSTYLGWLRLVEDGQVYLNNSSVNPDFASVSLSDESTKANRMSLSGEAAARVEGGVVGGIAMEFASSLTVSGGAQIGQLLLEQAAHARLNRGEYGRIDASGASKIDVRGGAFYDEIHLTDNAQLGVFGSQLAYNDGVLSGTLADGTSLSVPVKIEGAAKILFNQSAVGPSGHVRFNPANGHFYEAIPRTETRNMDPFILAREYSFSGIPGHLATITDASESQFVESEFPSHASGKEMYGLVGIGATDREEEGLWRWGDGPEKGTVFFRKGTDDVVEYANWGPGTEEPGNLFGEDYAVLPWQEGGWNDLRSIAGFTLLVEYSVMLGDANIDGVVDLEDFRAVKANFGRGEALHEDGDLNGDGVVNLTDFDLLEQNFGATGGPTLDWVNEPLPFDAAVPEPPATVLAMLGLLFLAVRYSRKTG